jgi:hypothetical protein
MADPAPQRDDTEQLLADLDHEVQVGGVSLVDYWRRRASIEAGHGDPRRSPATPAPAPDQPVGQLPPPDQPAPQQPVADLPSESETPAPDALSHQAAPVVMAPPPVVESRPGAIAPPPPPPPGVGAPQISWHELGAAVHGIPDEQPGTPTSVSEPATPEPGHAPAATSLVSPAPPDKPVTAVGEQPKAHHLYAPPEGAVRLPVQTSWEPQDPPNPPRWLARLSTKGDSSARGRPGRRRGWGRKG